MILEEVSRATAPEDIEIIDSNFHGNQKKQSHAKESGPDSSHQGNRNLQMMTRQYSRHLVKCVPTKFKGTVLLSLFFHKGQNPDKKNYIVS